MLRLEIARLHADQARYDGVKLNATLDRERLQLVLADRAERLNIHVDLEPEDSVWRLTLRNQSELDMGLLMGDQGVKGAGPQGKVSIDVDLTGTLAQPEVEVNVAGIVTHGGAAWATGGLSLVVESLFTSLTAFSNPCETVLNAIER